MENRKITELDCEELFRVTGGKWDSQTLTYAEWHELDRLYTRWFATIKRTKAEAEAEAALFAYVAELEVKYGPSGWTKDEWLRTE